jgi:folate-binding protein YgfZ
MSHLGRFIVRGKDAAALLHHLTTNDIKKLKSGEGCDAILITNKARVLDWLTIWREGDEYHVLTSPNRRVMFVSHAQKFILFRQEVEFQDVSEQGALFGLFGANIVEVLARLNAESILQSPFKGRIEVSIGIEMAGVGLDVSRTRRLPGEGVLIECDDGDVFQNLMREIKLPHCDDETYNVLRIEAGLPVTGLELTEDINPWEAELGFAISLDKGCYNGQEIIARLNTYQRSSRN